MPQTHEAAFAHKVLIPPHSVRPDFLPSKTAAELFAYILAHEEKFVPSRVGYDKRILDAEKRASLAMRDVGPFAGVLREKCAEAEPALAAAFKLTPFKTTKIELEIAAHGDGAFFSRHLDTARPGDTPRKSRRVLSGVYYLHQLPKAFSGGALRFHELTPQNGTPHFVDLEPQHNTAVFFPSWMPHEVMTVSCPSRRFADFRFAINCWFHEAI